MAEKPGRPPVEVNEKTLEKLTFLHLSDKVIADILGISVDTLHRRFADKMEVWRSQGKSKIASVLFDEAVNKREPWALKALAQKHLDYSDKVSTDEKSFQVVQTGEIDYEKLAQMIKDAK